MKKIKRIFFCFLIAMAVPSFAGWRDDHERGWHWYEKKEEPEIVKEKPQPAAASLSYAKQMEAYRQEGEELRAKAILYPTPEAVTHLMRWEKNMWEQSVYFGNVWQMMLRMNPDLDYSATHPSSQYARHIYLDMQKKKMKETFDSLRKEYGLIYFAKEACPYCTAMSPLVESVSTKYGLTLNKVVLDEQKSGKGIHNYQALAQQFNVTQVPALFAVNPKNGDYFPIAHGAVSEQELEERIVQIIQFRMAEEEKYAH